MEARACASCPGSKPSVRAWTSNIRSIQRIARRKPPPAARKRAIGSVYGPHAMLASAALPGSTAQVLDGPAMSTTVRLACAALAMLLADSRPVRAGELLVAAAASLTDAL